MPSARLLSAALGLAATSLPLPAADASPVSILPVAGPVPGNSIVRDDVSLSAPTTSSSSSSDDTPLPVIIWHGLGDDFSSEGMNSVADLIQATHPGTLVYRIAADPSSASADRTATFYGNVTAQVDAVCAALAAHPILSTAPAVDALGFSQGGQFLRGYVERCSGERVIPSSSSSPEGDEKEKKKLPGAATGVAPRVRSLVTFGAQHNGIVKYKACKPLDFVCRGAMALLDGQTWSPAVQGRLVPAQYFRDPADLPSYLAHSAFLADVNGERPESRVVPGGAAAAYADRLAALDHFVMHVFEDDTTVVPKESGWFAEVVAAADDDEDGQKVIPLRERPIYREDWIGLRRLDEKGGLHFISSPGEHMQLLDETLRDAFATYFGPLAGADETAGRGEGEQEGGVEL